MFEINTKLSNDFAANLIRSVNERHYAIQETLRTALYDVMGIEFKPANEHFDNAIAALKKGWHANNELIAKISTVVRPAVRTLVFTLLKDLDENIAWNYYKQLDTKPIELIMQDYCRGTIDTTVCDTHLKEYANNVQMLFCDVETLDNKE